MNIGCGTVLFRKFGLEKALEAIRSIGFEHFETQAVGPWCPHVNVERDDPERLVALKNKLGFRSISGLWSLNGNIIANPNAVESGVRSIEWAAAAGIPVLHTGDGNKPKDMSDDDAFRVFEEKLSYILEAARKWKVKVAIEPHGSFSLTASGLQRILSLGDASILGVNYDACNIFRAGYVESGNNRSAYKNAGNSEDELEVLKTVSSRVIHCHAKDINIQKECVAVGEGIVNVKGCLEHLTSIGYNGTVSVETEGGDDFEQIVALAAKSYRYLKSVIG